MEFSHYSENAELKPFNTKEQKKGIKPSGLWISVDGKDDWLEWCEAESFRPCALKYRHIITLREDAELLYLRTPVEINTFHSLYSVGPSAWMTYIDWPLVAESYSGIIIAPYQWSLRLNGPHWYYGWDCASGCIWDVSAILSTTLATSNKPSVHMEKEENEETSHQ